MRFLPLIVVSFLITLPGRAQERVRNVRIRVLDSARLEIRYDLLNARPTDSVYFQIRSRLRGSLLVLPDFVRGDVGKRIVAGSDRRIIWDALANGYSLNEDVRAVVLVKTGTVPVQTPPTASAAPPPGPTPAPRTPPPNEPTQRPATEPPSAPAQPTAPAPVTAPTLSPAPADSLQPAPKRRYAGPAWALLSAVAPGVGNIFVQTPRPRVGLRPLLTLGCYGLVAYGLRERQRARDSYALYEQQRNPTAAEPYYQQANDYHHRYYVATRGAAVVAAADVILTFFRGLRNQRTQRAARASATVTFRPGWQAGQPTMTMRYSF